MDPHLKIKKNYIVLLKNEKNASDVNLEFKATLLAFLLYKSRLRIQQMNVCNA
ncbi:hypothetical protein HMPREF0083_06074 [Aneurinibacillus aneurinilyticus ATCC 12856]|uniref:Uncharacterized protein n=1 Tax=Aneurinibacillus aneurinilyticus ATCC 12856 TaxID=649747 RepID=U1W7H1_ANEAE|nr:hypothetical protein HMPREF0083_06074 [Aneurinibacillus aneurinilyticus ATCC 12856]